MGTKTDLDICLPYVEKEKADTIVVLGVVEKDELD